MILILMSYCNVHLMHIMQLLLMEKLKHYDLLMVRKLELYETLLQQHKLQYNWIKYKIVYYVHHVMHKKQVNLLIFKVIINSRFQSIEREFKGTINGHCNTKIEFGFFDIEKEKKKEMQTQQQCHRNTSTSTSTTRGSFIKRNNKHNNNNSNNNSTIN